MNSVCRPPTSSRTASAIAPMSAAMLIVLATTGRPTSASVSQRGQTLARLAASPSPVTQPMRADSIWMPIISGVDSGSVQTSPKRNCVPGLYLTSPGWGKVPGTG